MASCSDYARNYTPPTLAEGAVRARNLLKPEQRREFDGIYLEALRQKYKGNDDAAFDLLERALKINPYDADALFQQGMILLQLTEFSDSVLRQRGERQLQLAHQLAPSNRYYRETLANYWLETRRNERALRLYEQIVTDEPTPDNLKMLETLQERTQHWEEALATVRKLEQVDEATLETTMKKVSLLEQLNRMGDAVAVLREWIEAHDGESYPRILLAHVYMRNGHWERGREIVEDVAATDPNNEYVPMLRMAYYREKNDTTRYEETLSKVVADANIELETKRTALNDATSWSKEGKFDKEKIYNFALIAMQQPGAGKYIGEWLVGFINDFKLPAERFAVPALAIYREDPTDERAISEMLRTAVRNNDALMLDTVCERGRELHPDNALFYFYGALAARTRNDDACAMEILREGTQKMAASTDSSLASELYYMLGDGYMQEKKLKLGFAAYNSSLVYDADNVHTLNNYAYFLTTNGMHLRRAVKMAQRATEIEPHNPSYLDTYAWALFKAGDFAAAKVVADSMWAAFALPNQEIEPDVDYYDRAGDIYFKAGFHKEAAMVWKDALQLTTDRKMQRKLRAKLKKAR